MDEQIMSSIIFRDITLLEISAKKYKPNKNNSGLNLTWEYKILNITEKKLTILAIVNTQLKGMFAIKSSYEADFQLLNPLSKEDIENHIEDVMYYCGAQHTLITSFLTNSMFGFPVPMAPNVKKADISIIE